jgi:hypothetical protein
LNEVVEEKIFTLEAISDSIGQVANGFAVIKRSRANAACCSDFRSGLADGFREGLPLACEADVDAGIA